MTGVIPVSAALDLLTGEEAEAMVRAWVAAGEPVQLTVNVAESVLLDPVDPGDRVFESAFNDRRGSTTGERPVLGGDAIATVTDLFRSAGWSVRVEDSSVQLDDADPRLVLEWLEGWIGVGVEARPALEEWADEYLRTRAGQLAAGTLHIEVRHQEILAWAP